MSTKIEELTDMHELFGPDVILDIEEGNFHDLHQAGPNKTPPTSQLTEENTVIQGKYGG